MKNLLLFTLLLFTSCSGVVTSVEQTNTEQQNSLRGGPGDCLDLEVGKNICEFMSNCYVPSKWIASSNPKYVETAMDLIRQNGFNQHLKTYTVSISGATCPLGNMGIWYCDYYGVNSTENPHTIGAIIEVPPHALSPSGEILAIFNEDCIPESQSIGYGREAADFYGKPVARFSIPRKYWKPGGIKFTVHVDGHSVVPKDIHILL